MNEVCSFPGCEVETEMTATVHNDTTGFVSPKKPVCGEHLACLWLVFIEQSPEMVNLIRSLP